MTETPLLEMRHIEKSFFGVKVLDNVSITLYAGEVLALLGENGAGKSTLIKILNGDYRLDAGEIYLHGKQMRFTQPRDAEEHGIRMIYQELKYAPDLSVMEHLLIGNLPTRSGRLGSFLIDWPRARAIAHERLSLLDLPIDPNRKMRELSVVERQVVEIVKALSAEAQIIVMDEPTAALTPPEVDLLFRIIRNLREKGVAIIYISHRLDEVFRVAQRVTVLRDGRHVATRPIGDVTLASLVELMIGREIEDRQRIQPPDACHTDKVLEVHHLSKTGAYEDVSLHVRAGEIVGIFGLIGSGQTVLTSSIFGAEKSDAGTIIVGGMPRTIRSPQDARNAGIGFVPIDRKVRGLIMGQSVRKNVTLSNWRKLAVAGFFRQGLEKRHTREWIKRSVFAWQAGWKSRFVT